MACACVFAGFGKDFRSGMNVRIVARTAEFSDLATEAAEVEAYVAPAAAPVQQGAVEVIYD